MTLKVIVLSFINISLLLLVEPYIPKDLSQFDLSNFDITLGMNLLHTSEAKINYKDLKVILNNDKGREVCFYGQREERSYF